MPRPRHNTTFLPRGLRQELGIRDRFGEKKKRRIEELSRQERRQEERAGRKAPGPATTKRGRTRGRDEYDDEEVFDGFEDGSDYRGDLGESDEEEDVMAKLRAAKQKNEKPNSITKKTKKALELTAEDEKVADVPRKKVSKAVQEKLEQDDAEIAALEKKLGLKKGKIPKNFADDGLGDLLGDLDEGSADESRKRKREADEWLLNKRRKAQGLEPVGDSEEPDSDLGSDEDFESFDDMGDMAGLEDDEDQESEEEQTTPKKKENPYIAPVPAAAEPQPPKYIPPSLRAASNSESESLTRLRRQAQGQLNKLSEANLVSILAEFEKLYREYPRQNVTSTLLSLLFGLICERSALQDTFIILHAGFIAAVYRVVGTDFGAEIVQKIVETFDTGGDERGKFEGKETINLIALLSQLYNFHVIGSTLIFDYIRLFLQDINEENTELLLKIIRNSGPQLRQDDPSSLKDIVLLIQPAVVKAGADSLSVRTKFMIDTITDLKNNRLKSAANSTVASEHITKMRKILGLLNNSRVIRASEPISISRNDIHNSSKKGKWWLVGASWKEDPLASAQRELSTLPSSNQTAAATGIEDDSDGEPDYASLAKAHRMNTDVRRSIFVAIMSATDYQDAHVRLLKLRLKRAQEFEIPRVLTHCALEEEAYNPYYTLIARRLCGELGRRIKVSFMYTLWNVFKRMGETGDLGDDEDDDGFHGEDEENALSMKEIVNLAKMYASLIADGTLTLGVLKTLNFAYLQPKTKNFAELLMISIIQQSQKKKKKKKKKKGEKPKLKSDGEESEFDEKPLVEIFMRSRDTPQIVKGCIFFLRKVVAKTDIVSSDKEEKMVKWGVRVAVDALKVVEGEEGGAL
ncbi:MIF4G domain-containing protein [Aspergillus lucknowensis]|uniref:MI domain-containing protein n=1 Tax=Aspergillus lucknowensis TaxID=176173 RepID=A0ABR4LVY5_9EURO